MKSKLIGGLLAGLAIFCGLFVWQGTGKVVDLFADGGWALLAVCLFAPTDQLMGAEAYRRLFRGAARPPVGVTWMASWMGSAVNTLLPVATIGGEVLKARMLMLWRGPKVYTGEQAVAAMVVDKTVQAVVVLIWALVGIAMLASITEDRDVVIGALIGAALLAVGIGGFVWVQFKGATGFMARTADNASGGKWAGIVERAETVDDEIRGTYRRPAAFCWATSFRLAARVVLVGEVVLAAHLMGHPITIVEALMLKGMVTGIRGVAFAIPGGVGAQEGGYIVVGALAGLSPELMLAVSLATRVREIVPNIPFLIYWQIVEGRHQWRRA